MTGRLPDCISTPFWTANSMYGHAITRRAMLVALEDLHNSGVEDLPIPAPIPAPPARHNVATKSQPPVDSARAAMPTLRQEAAVHPPSVTPQGGQGALFEMAEASQSSSSSSAEKSTADTLEVLAGEVAACTRCTELAKTRTQTVFADGNPEARLVFLGEAPGADEDAQGKPFVGRAGKLLTDIIEQGMKLRRDDVYIMNILKCRPPGNRNPLPHEAHNCRRFLLRQLELVAPDFICCLGSVAAQNLLETTQPIGKMRGRFYDWSGIRVMCTYHPAYLLRNPSAKRLTWEDIRMLMDAMGLPTEAAH